MMKNPWIFPAAALAVGAIGGYISGKNTQASVRMKGDEQSAIRMRTSPRDDAPAAVSKARTAVRLSPDEISRIPGSTARLQSLIDYYASLSPSQLAEEAKKLDGMPMNDRIMAAFLLFGRWGETDPTAAMNFAGTMGFSGGFVRPMVLQSWASIDPSGAARYVTENPREFAMMGVMGGRGPGGSTPSSIIAGEWAKQDSAAAMKWAVELTNDKDRAMASVVSEVAKTDPKKAAEMIATNGMNDDPAAYDPVAMRYGAADFGAAKSWVATLPAEEQGRALASTIGGLSNSDPDAAAKEILAVPDGGPKNRVVAEIAEDLARIDPVKAGEFVKTQSAQAQEDAMREMIPAWVAQDASGALAYANSLEAGKVRDEALQSYVMSNNSSNPAELVKVAETIGDEGDRSRALGMAAARWMREDAEAAKSYIQQSTTISDRAKNSILEGRGPWGGRGGRGGRGR
ncbi:MAG: hypothetical protein V4733_03980 [Verrucomicrobiota bacterium]